MEVSFSNNILTINGNQISFDESIKDIKEFNDLILVLLTVPQGKINNRNVVAVSKNTIGILWIIEEADLFYDDCPYTNFIDNSDEIIIGNWNGISYIINEQNGHKIKGVQTK